MPRDACARKRAACVSVIGGGGGPGGGAGAALSPEPPPQALSRLAAETGAIGHGLTGLGAVGRSPSTSVDKSSGAEASMEVPPRTGTRRVAVFLGVRG